MRILEFELLNGPPGRGGEGANNFVFPLGLIPECRIPTIRPLPSKMSEPRLIIIDGRPNHHNNRPPDRPSDCEVSGVTVLHDNEAGFAVDVVTVRNSQELTRDTTIDSELAIWEELECCPTRLGVEHLGELLGSKLGS